MVQTLDKNTSLEGLLLILLAQCFVVSKTHHHYWTPAQQRHIIHNLLALEISILHMVL